MTASVVVDFHHEPEFPKLDNGERPRIELIREQVAGYVEGYTVAKGHKPARIALQASDLLHCQGAGPNAEAPPRPGKGRVAGAPQSRIEGALARCQARARRVGRNDLVRHPH